MSEEEEYTPIPNEEYERMTEDNDEGCSSARMMASAYIEERVEFDPETEEITYGLAREVYDVGADYIEYECEDCGRTFRSDRDLREHFNEDNEEDPVWTVE